MFRQRKIGIWDLSPEAAFKALASESVACLAVHREAYWAGAERGRQCRGYI